LFFAARRRREVDAQPAERTNAVRRAGHYVRKGQKLLCAFSAFSALYVLFLLGKASPPAPMMKIGVKIASLSAA
jgi:hypothetical protein